MLDRSIDIRNIVLAVEMQQGILTEAALESSCLSRTPNSTFGTDQHAIVVVLLIRVRLVRLFELNIVFTVSVTISARSNLSVSGIQDQDGIRPEFALAWLPELCVTAHFRHIVFDVLLMSVAVDASLHRV
jgi:hypothetical protein